MNCIKGTNYSKCSVGKLMKYEFEKFDIQNQVWTSSFLNGWNSLFKVGNISIVFFQTKAFQWFICIWTGKIKNAKVKYHVYSYWKFWRPLAKNQKFIGLKAWSIKISYEDLFPRTWTQTLIKFKIIEINQHTEVSEWDGDREKNFTDKLQMFLNRRSKKKKIVQTISHSYDLWVNEKHGICHMLKYLLQSSFQSVEHFSNLLIPVLFLFARIHKIFPSHSSFLILIVNG